MSNNSSFHIGIRIKELREKAGLTQEELAKIIGYKSRSTINKIEMGKNDIPQNKIIKFANALNVPPIVVMGWDIPDISDMEGEDSAHMGLRQNGKTSLTIDLLQNEIYKMNETKLQKLLEYARFINKN